MEGRKMSEIYEALTGIGIVFLILILIRYSKNLAIKHRGRLHRAAGVLITPLFGFLLTGYTAYKRKKDN